MKSYKFCLCPDLSPPPFSIFNPQLWGHSKSHLTAPSKESTHSHKNIVWVYMCMFWLIFILNLHASLFFNDSHIAHLHLSPLLLCWTTQRENMWMCVCWAANKGHLCTRGCFFHAFPQSVFLWHVKGHWLRIAVFTDSQGFCGLFKLFLHVLINLERAAGLIMSIGNWGQTLLKQYVWQEIPCKIKCYQNKQHK